MAECEYAEWLMRYHDGELAEGRRREVEAHLSGCPRCAAALEGLRALSEALAGAEVPSMPRGMTARLHRAVARAGDAGLIRLCRAISLAAAALLAACGVWALSPGEAAAGAAEPAAWEVAAVTLDAELARQGDGDVAALWLVQDLSREDGR